MFKKVLVSDDLDCINQGIVSVLNSLNIDSITQVAYCDDAFLKIEKAIADNEPFELLITDLSFVPDHREQTYTSGEALISALKQRHPQLKIIAYSVEDKFQKVRTLMLDHNLDGYVCKGRHGLKQIILAIQEVLNGRKYLSPQVQNALNNNYSVEISDYDIEVLKLLSHGNSQKEISENFSLQNLNPSSLSSIEKKISKLCDHFKAKNTIHLVAIVKDLGLI